MTHWGSYSGRRNLPEIDDEEALIVLELLARIFEYDPQKRPTAEQLLEEAWFLS